MAEYHGWGFGATKIAGENAALQVDAYDPPTSFTPINRPGAQHLILQPSASSRQPDPARTVNTTKHRKQHNPVIAQYLGLGTHKEPPHLEKYAPVLPPTPTTPLNTRKRNRKVRDGDSPSKTDCPTQPKKSKQRRVSDGFRITKAASHGTRRVTCKDVTPSDVSSYLPNTTKNGVDPPNETNRQAEEVRQSLQGADATGKGPVNMSSSTNTTTLTRASTTHTMFSPSVSSSVVASNTDIAQPCADVQDQDSTVDEFFDDVFDSIDLDDTVNQLATNTQLQDTQSAFSCSGLVDSSTAFLASEDFLPYTPDLTDHFSSPFQQKWDGHESNLGLVNERSDRVAAPSPLHLSSMPDLSGKFMSPITQRTEALIYKEAMISTHTTDRKPIVRHLFPDPVRDRSPIIGLSSNLLLRTCFRIGETINQAAKAIRNGHIIMFELYARVLSSERNAVKQHFVFSDLFHDRPPYLKGEYDAAIWKQVELFNYDSGRLLSKAKMCRCIGSIKRNENKEWIMVVLNVWEATWEDIDWVEGIVNS